MTARKNWDERMVAAYLEEAAAIHRRLPEVKAHGYYSLWPETMKDDWERLYDAIHSRSRPGPPMPSEVTRHERTMEWLRWLSPYHQKIVWMRANSVPWKILEAEFGRDKTTLWRERKCALARIASILSIRENG